MDKLHRQLNEKQILGDEHKQIISIASSAYSHTVHLSFLSVGGACTVERTLAQEELTAALETMV